MSKILNMIQQELDEQYSEEDFYCFSGINKRIEEGTISASEAGFMQGYLDAEMGEL